MKLREEIEAMLVGRIDQDPLLTRLADDPTLSGSVEEVFQDFVHAYVGHTRLIFAAIRRIADVVDEIDIA